MTNEKKLRFPTEPTTPTQPFTNQYKQPTDFAELPSKGKFYAENHPLRDKENVELYFMTTKEEDILTSASLCKQGLVLDKLIESLLVNKNIKAKTLLPGDKSAILMNARKNAYDSDYRFVILCEVCVAKQEIFINLEEIKPKENSYDNVEFTDSGNFLVTLPKTQATVELKLLTSEEEEEIIKTAEQKAKHNLPETAASDRLRQVVVSVGGNNYMLFISEFISRMPIADSKFIKEVYMEVVPDVDLTFSHTCTECEYVNKGVVPMTGEFFWPNK